MNSHCKKAKCLNTPSAGHELCAECLYAVKAREAGAKPPAFVKQDDGKFRYTLLPTRALKSVVAVLEYGAKKYQPHNWKLAEQGDARERYTNAIYRHLAAMNLGEETDPESGLPHAAHVACNALFILGFMLGDA